MTPLNFIRAESHEVMRLTRNLMALAGDDGLNEFYHFRTTELSSDFPVVRPNCDTLYSMAVIDTQRGPLQITLPPVSDG